SFQSLTYHIFFYLFYRTHLLLFFFFLTAPPTTEIYTLSLHDALPICYILMGGPLVDERGMPHGALLIVNAEDEKEVRDKLKNDPDRKSTRLNSSHLVISYAVFCLKKKKKKKKKKKIHKKRKEKKIIR